MTLESSDRELRDERELARTMSRYARGLDERDWDGFDAVFAPDAQSFYQGQVQTRNLKEWVRAARSALGGCGPTQHLIGNFVAEITGDAADSRAYFRAFHTGSGDKAHLIYDVVGEYLAAWQRRPEGWRIVRLELKIAASTGDSSVLGPAKE